MITRCHTCDRLIDDETGCTSCAKIISSRGIKLNGTEGEIAPNQEELLKEEIAAGAKIALELGSKLAKHLMRMGAGSATFPVACNGVEFRIDIRQVRQSEKS